MMGRKRIRVIFGIIILTATAISTVFAAVKKGSWGDKEIDGIREGSESELYNPARYAFDGDEATFWKAEYGKEYIWAERYRENEEDIESVEVLAELSNGSRINFSYEKEGTWIQIQNGIIEGPLNGSARLDFTEEQRKTKRILVVFQNEGNSEDRIYEIKVNRKDSSRNWGKIEPEKYSFNLEEYINLKPSRLWDGYIKECWYEPIWYVPYEIQQSKEYRSGIFAPYNGNPSSNGEIIWELDGKYRVDFIKAYFDAGWRNIAFEFWDGETWKGKKEFKNINKIGWNRLEVNNKWETEKIKITFPSGWENARFINQIEIWGEGERKNDVSNILFTETSEQNEYNATIENENGCTEIELITEGSSKEAVRLYLNGNEYILNNPEFKTEFQNIYRTTFKEEDKRNGFQYLKIKTGNNKLKGILVRDNVRNNGRIITKNQYSDRYKGYREGSDGKEYKKKITLDRKYEIEKIIIYTHNGEGLKISGNKKYGNYDYTPLTNERYGVWSVDLKGKECSELNIASDCEFEIDEAEIFGSPLEDKECAVEIWNNTKNVDRNSCIVGWKGSRESQVVIDGNIYPRQEGCLFWMPVKEIRGSYLENETHEVICSEGKINSKKRYYVNAADDTRRILEEIGTTPLLLTIDIPYGEIFTQSEEMEISGRYGNGDEIKVYVNGEKSESGKGKYKTQVQLNEGENYIRVNAEDKTGRISEKTVKIIKDSTKPVIELLSPEEGEYINTGKAEFIIDGKEDDELWWQFNEEEWESGNGRIKYKDYYLEDGFYTYTVRAQDRSGNISEEHSVNFCMDETAPEPFAIGMNVEGWTNNNQPTVIFETSDATGGVDYYEYKIDDGLWIRCESPLKLNILEDGVRNLYIRAVDKAGNITEESTELYIDTSIPPQPVDARPVSSDNSILVKWTGINDDSIVNGGYVAQEGNRDYRIERNPEWSTGDKLLKDYGYGQLCFEDTDVEIGQSYSYRICAIDRAGNKSEKTEWKSAITGLAVSDLSEDGDTVVEYDGMTVTIPKGAAAEDIIKIQINRITDDLIEEESLNPVVGSTYMITAVRQKDGELYITNHADLNIPAVIEISYKPSLIPENYLNSEIAPYYYDDIWGCWMRMPESYINTENHTVLFRTEHFTEFQVQATKKTVLSEAELREGSYKLSSGKIGPSDIRISGEDGGVSYEFTEYIMPGKAGLELPIQRVYTTAKAWADSSEDKDSRETTKIDGESVWSIADGWKINMPYMKVNVDSIVIYGTDGQCFTSGQMEKVTEDSDVSDPTTPFSIFMENHEYTDTRVQMFFYKKVKWNPIITMLTLGIFGDYTVYTFDGAILHQGDGKKIYFDSKGRVTYIKDCTENQKIHFEYNGDTIKITDSLENEISLVRNNDCITRINAGDNSIEYIIQDNELKSVTDIGKREWIYSYKEELLESKSELVNPPSGYTQSEPKKYKVKTLTEISGNGYGYTKIEYEVKNDLVYKDTVNSTGKNYTYEITQGKLYAKKKTESLTDNDVLRTTDYTIEYAGAVDKQFYVSKSIVNDGNIRIETNYSTVKKERYRLSNAPEAIKKYWSSEEKTGEQEKSTKQLLTYASSIKTFTEGPVQTVTNEIDSSLMRMKKVITKKGEKNQITDDFTYDSNGNVTKEIHEYKTDGKTSFVQIDRVYQEPVNNRINLVSMVTKKSSGFVDNEEKLNTTEETYVYNKYGQMTSKTTDNNTWKYSYYEEEQNAGKTNGLLKSETSPQNRVTEYDYDYSGSDGYKVTVKRKAENEDDSITETKCYYRQTGNLTKETDADNYETEYEYDALGRMTIMKKNEGKSVINVLYNDKNLMTSVTDALGCITRNQFDNLGRLVKVTKEADDTKITILLEYDNYDRVIKMSEPFYGDNVTDISKTDYTSYEYDRLGRITKLTDADKKITDYAYVDSLNMTETSKAGLEKTRVYKDNLGNIIKQENWIKENLWTSSESWYDGEGKILCTKDENQNETVTEYNKIGKVSCVTYPDGLKEESSYDKDGILDGITRFEKDTVLSKEEYKLDNFGRVKEKKTFVEPDNTNSKKVVESYKYNKRGYVTEEKICYENETSDVRAIKKEYDWAGNVIEQTDGEDRTTFYDYDAKGNLVKLTDPREKNSNYNGEYFMCMEYDKFGRLVKGWIPHAQRRYDFSISKTPVDVLIEYDAQGNVTKRTDNAGDAAGAVVTEYEYTKAGVIKSETCGTLNTKYEYDNAGRLIKITDTNGIVTNRSYDGSGRLILEKLEGENTSLHYEYYANGTVKSRTDRKGNITEYEYDSMNHLVKEDMAGLIKKTYGWDRLGRKLWENDGEKNLRNYEYDGLDRLIKEETPDGIILLYNYDASGNVTEYIDGRKTKFVREYTKTDLLKKEMAFAQQSDETYSENPSEIRTYEHDEAGLLKTATDSVTSISYNQVDGTYESDAYGNIRSMKWSSIGLEMKYDYDLLGRTTGVTIPDGNKICYEYDANGRLSVMSGFLKGNIKYDENKSRIQSYTLENGIERTFNYNNLGNISSINYLLESKGIKTGFSYDYDDNYNIKSRTALDTYKTSLFSYDKADRLTQSQMYGAFETRETLDNRRLAQIERDLDGTKDIEAYFDILPQNIILDTSARAFVYDFERAVSLNKIELFPDVSTHRVRERDMRIYFKETKGSDWEEITDWKFEKDERNGSLCFAFKQVVKACQIKVRCIWDDRNFQNVNLDLKATFKGNPQNLLRIWTLEENRFEDYGYDNNSNRIQLTENGINYSYEYYKNKDGGNTTRVMYDGKWWYIYDANGNRTARASNAVHGNNKVTIDKTSEYWEYTWDLWNRLVKVEQHNAPDNTENVCVEYVYDVLNYRIQRVSRTKTVEETTQYAYGRNGAITYQKKTVGENVTSRSYTYLNNQMVGWTEREGDTEQKYYTVTDIQGSVTEVYDEAKNLVWKSGYTAFGIKAGEVTNLIDFNGFYTGCDYDAETGLSYHWNRWRSEKGESWLSEDPARDGCNWYGYAGQNPTTFVDINGLFPAKQTSGSKNEESKNDSSPQEGPTNDNLCDEKSLKDISSTVKIKEKTSGYLFLLYRNGTGTNRTLRELGLLEKIKNAVDNNPKLTGKRAGTITERFIKQIVERKDTEFRNSYNFLSEKFAIGSATVEGRFNGDIYNNEDGSTHIEGIITYSFEDVFTDPYDIFNLIPGEWNPDGKSYKITDTWQKEIKGDY